METETSSVYILPDYTASHGRICYYW